jgi:iron complex outermembrane recepter protein
MRMRHALHTLLCGCLLGAAPVAGQQPLPPPPDTAVALDTLEVTATRTGTGAGRVPAAVTLVDARAVQAQQPGLALDETLRGVPGVYVANRHNAALDARVTVRGFGARAGFGVRGVRLLMDGVPLTMPDGQTPLNNVDVAALDRVEVIRGPASALHGNAAGGVIALETRPPPVAGWGGEARLLAGDQGTNAAANLRRAELRLGHGWETGGVSAGVSHLRSTGFREHARSEQTLLTARARYAPTTSPWAVNWALHGVDAPVALNPGSLTAADATLTPRAAAAGNVATGSGKAVRQLQSGITLTGPAAAARIDVTLYGLDREMENPLPFAFIAVDRTGGGIRTTVRGATTVFEQPVGWSAGFDAERQRDHRREWNNDAGRPGETLRRHQVDVVASVAPFVQGRWTVHERVEASLGARYDAFVFQVRDRLPGGAASGTRRLGALSPAGGVLVALTPRVGAFGNITTSFQTPTTTELINAPPAPGTPCCPAGFNETLEPQRTVGYELGGRARLGAARVEAAAYAMNLTGELIPFQVSEAPGRNFYRNAGHSRHQGAELALAAPLATWLAASVAYGYGDFRFRGDEHDGNRIPGLPPHRLAASLRAALGAGNATAELEWIDGYPVNDANTSHAAGHVLLHLRGGAGLPAAGRPLRAFAGVSNILDRRHIASVVLNAAQDRFFEPGPGRSLFAGLAVPLGQVP